MKLLVLKCNLPVPDLFMGMSENTFEQDGLKEQPYMCFTMPHTRATSGLAMGK
jgi:hypothetical protein